MIDTKRLMLPLERKKKKCSSIYLQRKRKTSPDFKQNIFRKKNKKTKDYLNHVSSFSILSKGNRNEEKCSVRRRKSNE